MNPPHEAPRLRAYLESGEGRPVLHMSRSDWSSIYTGTGPELVSIERLPMNRVATDATVVAAYAQRFSMATAEVAIVRLDPPDAPNIYNTDKYEVWEDLPSHQSFRQIVQAASTEDNENLRAYLAQTVFLVKREPDDEHQLPELPLTAQLLLRQRSM